MALASADIVYIVEIALIVLPILMIGYKLIIKFLDEEIKRRKK